MGNIFDIQRMSVHDGPGIRTTVFLKGCPLRCLWCHNPESQSARTLIGYDPEKCAGCAECTKLCRAHSVSDGAHTYDRSLCIACGKCADICSGGAILKSGYDSSADEIIKEVLKDKIFYKTTKGGVTFSGGEPLSQPDFLKELLIKAKENGLNTALDTSGFGKSETLREIAPYTDLFLWDYKESNEERHIEYTGVSRSLIIENLGIVNSLGKDIVLRCPIIPSFNDRDDHFEGIASVCAAYECIKSVNVMAFHKLGDGKYTAFDMKNETEDIPAMQRDEAERIVRIIKEKISKKTDRIIPVEA